MKLKDFLISKINKVGEEVTVRKLKTKEIIKCSFEAIFDYDSSEYDEKYIVKKLKKYDSEIKTVIKILKKDRNSRQCVIQFPVNKKLPECITQIQFLVRNNKLTCLVISRSMDIKKLYTDCETVRIICDRVCKELNIELQNIEFVVGSLHYYI